MRYLLLGVVLSLAFSSCDTVNDNWANDAQDPVVIRQSLDALTDVIVHDIFSPPVASRIYSYATIAAYEAYQTNDDNLTSFTGRLNEFAVVPAAKTNVCYPMASALALCQVGKALVFSEAKIDGHVDSLLTYYQAIRMPADIYQNTITYADEVATAVLSWASGDNYAATRSYPKHAVLDEQASWQPTPPAYMDGIEPSWNKIRPFTLDSAQQFQPPFPTEYSVDQSSTFYKELLEVYNAVNDASKEHVAIASFWDCNPYVLNVTGHVMHATKKITPGGHWMGIVGIASDKANLDYGKTIEAYAITAIALADAFISCWDEKYRSNLIRPETVINEHIDPTWRPLLQTPPFPEYTSGHSVISAAAATVLTDLFGDDFAFDDSSEVKYGLPVRSYTSFIHASDEAAISRLYGGIHYRPAIDNGVEQGRKLGAFVSEALDL